MAHGVEDVAFGFNELSDGYSSVIQITSSLMLVMEQNWLKKKQNINDYKLEDVALIDELETHLHSELQRKILPFLTEIFPRNMYGYSIDNVAEAYSDSEDYSVTLEAQWLKLNVRTRKNLDAQFPRQLKKFKTAGKCNTPEVVDALEETFHGKCYICEYKGATSWQVEHLQPHQER